jgi:hypothetical protein
MHRSIGFQYLDQSISLCYNKFYECSKNFGRAFQLFLSFLNCFKNHLEFLKLESKKKEEEEILIQLDKNSNLQEDFYL